MKWSELQQFLFHSFYPPHSKWNSPAVAGNRHAEWTAPALHLLRWSHYWSGWKLSSLSSEELTPPSYSCGWLEISTWAPCTYTHPFRPVISRKWVLCFWHTPITSLHNLTHMLEMLPRRQCHAACKLPKGLQRSDSSLQDVNKPGPACHHTKPPAAEMTGIVSQKTHSKSKFFIPLLRKYWFF